MLANRKRKRSHRRKRAVPAGLKAYWANKRRSPSRRRRRRNPLRIKHVISNRRRRVHRRNPIARRRSRSGGGGLGVPSNVAGFVSMPFLMKAGMVAVGAVAPSLVTDKLLPMVGLTFTGYTRRIVQFAVPVVVVLFGKKLLGKHAAPFVLGAAGATLLGLVNDVTGGMATIAGPGLGRYQLPAPSMAGGTLGRYSATAKVLTR